MTTFQCSCGHRWESPAQEMNCPQCNPAVKGRLIACGTLDVQNDDDLGVVPVERALLITFESNEAVREAIKRGSCEFEVFWTHSD